MKKECLYLDWCNKFRCPGGDCGLTCCTADWKIPLNDYEIEMYENLDHPFREELLNAIDYEKKSMKCSRDVCDLLDDNYYCKLVNNCGPDKLSYTCSSFPWKSYDYGPIVENTVEMVCPVVAEYLLDDEQIGLDIREVDVSDNKISTYSDETYLALFKIRAALFQTIQSYPCKYIYGKVFIFLKALTGTKKLLEENTLIEGAEELTASLFEPEIVENIFLQCEVIDQGINLRKQMIFATFLRVISAYEQPLLLYIHKYKPDIKNVIYRWRTDEEAFYKDMLAYVSYIKANHKLFVENFLMYSIFCDWAGLDTITWGQKMKTRLTELFLIQICCMAIFRTSGSLNREEFGVAVACIDRKIAHNSHVAEQLSEYFDEMSENDPMFFMFNLIA